MDVPNMIKMNRTEFQKMTFIINALNDGWTVKKEEDKFVFTKKHENRREIFEENYLSDFINNNMKIWNQTNHSFSNEIHYVFHWFPRLWPM